jgi:hypothetical protein
MPRQVIVLAGKNTRRSLDLERKVDLRIARRRVFIKKCISRSGRGHKLRGQEGSVRGKAIMASTSAAIGGDLRRLFDAGSLTGLTDKELLDRLLRRDGG